MKKDRKQKVAVFSLYDSSGASSRYRVLQYVDDLKHVAELNVYTFWPNIYVDKYMLNKRKYSIQIAILFIVCALKRTYQMLFIAPKYDSVIIQKAVIPMVKNTFASRINHSKTRIAFDVDDAVFLRRGDNSEKIAEISDVVYCGSDELRLHYLKFNKNSVFLPTVDCELKYKEYIHNTFENKIIGWIGNSVNLKNLEILVNPINNIAARHPETRFVIICNDDGGYTSRIKNSQLAMWGIDTYMENLSNITIGVMPLEDTPYNRGKCAFKLVQYMTMNKPVVASPVGANIAVTKQGGYLASSEAEWEIAIETLLYNEEKYSECIQKIQADFSQNFSYKKNLEVIKNFILKGADK